MKHENKRLAVVRLQLSLILGSPSQCRVRLSLLQVGGYLIQLIKLILVWLEFLLAFLQLITGLLILRTTLLFHRFNCLFHALFLQVVEQDFLDYVGIELEISISQKAAISLLVIGPCWIEGVLEVLRLDRYSVFQCLPKWSNTFKILFITVNDTFESLFRLLNTFVQTNICLPLR